MMKKDVKMKKLKSCPFCGGKALLYETLDKLFTPFCSKCKAQFPNNKSYKRKADAINSWNKRIKGMKLNTTPPTLPMNEKEN